MLLLSVPAGAKPGFVVTPAQRSAEFKIKGSHGYAIQVKLWNRRILEVSAYKNPDVVVYLTRRVRAQGDAFYAVLPGLGRISLYFRARGRPHHEPGFFPPCNGGETTKQPGYFEGTIRLRGEHGYTSAQATRVHGQIVTTAKEVCRRSTFGKESKPNAEDAAKLFAWSGSTGRSVVFSAVTFGTPNLSSPASTFFSGAVRERRQGMAIFREATARGSADDLTPTGEGEYPASGTVTPTSPFSGSASFQRSGDSGNSWLGNLSVVLPGVGRVALAGPDFSARFCQGCHP
jgi:hypothetical protein